LNVITATKFKLNG